MSVNFRCTSRPNPPRAAPAHLSRSLAERQSAELRRLQRQRYAQRIWRLGDRVQFELVEKFIKHFGIDEEAARQILDRFAGLDIEALRALGADRLPSSVIRQVQER
jgi:hypothetical protein